MCRIYLRQSQIWSAWYNEIVFMSIPNRISLYTLARNLSFFRELFEIFLLTSEHIEVLEKFLKTNFLHHDRKHGNNYSGRKICERLNRIRMVFYTYMLLNGLTSRNFPLWIFSLRERTTLPNRYFGGDKLLFLFSFSAHKI